MESGSKCTPFALKHTHTHTMFSGVRIEKSLQIARFYLISLHWLHSRTTSSWPNKLIHSVSIAVTKNRNTFRALQTYFKLSHHRYYRPIVCIQVGSRRRCRREWISLFIIPTIAVTRRPNNGIYFILHLAYFIGALVFVFFFFFRFELLSSDIVRDENRLMIGERAVATETNEHFCRL